MMNTKLTRLEQMKAYREEAMLSPEENALYIEDLNLSIAYFESAKQQKQISVQTGFRLTEES